MTTQNFKTTKDTRKNAINSESENMLKALSEIFFNSTDEEYLNSKTDEEIKIINTFFKERIATAGNYFDLNILRLSI